MAADLRVDWWSERVLVLTIDRPARRNPVDHELLSALATGTTRLSGLLEKLGCDNLANRVRQKDS